MEDQERWEIHKMNSDGWGIYSSYPTEKGALSAYDHMTSTPSGTWRVVKVVKSFDVLVERRGV